MIVRRTELTPDIIELFKTAIREEFQNGMDNMNGVSVYEQFNSNPGSIVLIFEVGEEGDKLISSLPYTFHDYRFTKANQDLSIYSDQTDCSCILVYNEGKFEVLQVYPTIYYNKEKGDFCWSINGIRTSLVAQGPVGEDGKPGVPKLVTISDHVNDSSLYVIEQIMYNGEWVDTYLNSSISHREQCRMMDLDNNCPVLV
ncbi:MAG: hypothetical protein IKU29_05380, partial [Parabacteroides sp.]|nr:hypothetical protein [Parabacteroides sp.]